MSDNQTPTPPHPEYYEIPVQLIEQWAEIRADERITTALTKQDIDNLVLGLLRGSDAIAALEAAVVHWSNGRVDEANRAVQETRRLNIESQNRVRHFITGLIIAALRGRRNG